MKAMTPRQALWIQMHRGFQGTLGCAELQGVAREVLYQLCRLNDWTAGVRLSDLICNPKCHDWDHAHYCGQEKGYVCCNFERYVEWEDRKAGWDPTFHVNADFIEAMHRCPEIDERSLVFPEFSDSDLQRIFPFQYKAGDPSSAALEAAARCWCDEETQDLTMIPALAKAFAKRIDTLQRRLSTSDVMEENRKLVQQVEALRHYVNEVELNTHNIDRMPISQMEFKLGTFRTRALRLLEAIPRPIITPMFEGDENAAPAE